MGRPRIKTIDDSTPEAEEKKQKAKPGKIKQAKSEADKASGKVERTSEVDDSNLEQDAKQAPSEHTGDTSGALQPDEPTSVAADRSKKPQKPGKAKPRSKKYQEVVKDLDRNKLYPLEAAIDLAKKMSYSKINATLEAHINTAQTGIRGLVSLPYASGRQLRILAFGPSTTPKTSKLFPSEIEGVIFGSDEVIEKINTGKVDFDLIITTPEWMPKLTKVAKILGPKGLMPNPKNNTITDSSAAGFKKAIESFQAGKTEYKTEPKAPVMHIALGKLNQPTEELVANVKTLLQTIGKSRIKKVTLSPTMGPSVRVDLASV